MTEGPAAARRAPRSWRLDLLLSALVVAATVLTFAVVGSGVLLMRLPALDDEHRDLVKRHAADFAERQQVFLGSIERRLELLAHALRMVPADQAQALMDVAVGDGRTLRAVYHVSGDGHVDAVGLAAPARTRRAEVLGSDLSRLPLLREAPTGGLRSVWGDKFVSPLSGEATVGVRQDVPGGGHLLAEVPLSALLRIANAAGQVPEQERSAITMWLVDSRGEVLVDSDYGAAVGRVNLRGSPLLPPVGAADVVQLDHDIGNGLHHVAVAHASALNWTFIAHVPAGLAHPRARASVAIVLAAFAGVLAVGLALAPLMARRLAGAVRQLVDHARRLAEGGEPHAWPRGAVREVNELADTLGATTGALRRRERELEVIFNAAPVAMAVSRLDGDASLIAANEAWCRLFGYERDKAVGRPAVALNMWFDAPDREQAFEQLARGHIAMEARLRRADATAVLCRVSGRTFAIGDRRYVVWANEDITETRRIERALRDLNLELERRVDARTHDLEQANAELQGTLARLQDTRHELLQSEKLAALGRMVAGVAHELNTPLGNALMAVSTLRDDTTQFRDELAQGLRRRALDELLDSIDQATAIAGRNLTRAGELVSGFKQVAADQTSDQRRRFRLDEVVGEIVLTLKPSFGRTPFSVATEVEPALVLDSYPGALGQVLTNLVTNAVVHGLDGRERGTVTVRGHADGDDQVRVEVSDDGCGIAPELIARVFDPFVTTRMGRGGTGLGLNIAHNVTTQILGGTLTVRSPAGEGATFILRIPRVAPTEAPRPG